MKNYSGNREPFALALYDPADEKEARPILEQLAESRRLCAVTALGKKEEAMLDKASLALLFLSPASLDAMEEVGSAAVLRREKPLIPVFLAPVTLSPGLRMLLGSTQGVRFDGDREAAMAELLASPAWGSMAVTPAQKRSARRSALGIGLAGAAALVIALLSVLLSGGGARIDPGSTLGRLGLSGNVRAVRAVYLYGAELKSSWEDKGAYQAADGRYSEAGLLYLPGTGEKVERGELSDLTDFAQLTNLEELSLAGNRVSDITPLLGLSKLRRLDLSNQSGESPLDIRGIEALTNLEELYLTYDELHDSVWDMLDTLAAMPKLKRIYFDWSNAGVADSLRERGVPFEVVQVDTVANSFDELKAAANDPGVYFIAVRDTFFAGDIVIPEGEEIVIGAHQYVGSNFAANLINRGTLRVCGTLGLGRSEFHNQGLLVVEDGGLLGGGMSDYDSTGRVELRPGGRMQLERGLVFSLNGGRFVNEGRIVASIGGHFVFNGGELINDGLMEIDTDLAVPERDAARQAGSAADWRAIRFSGDTAKITGSGELRLLGDGRVAEE